MRQHYKVTLSQVGTHPPHQTCPTIVKHSFIPRWTGWVVMVPSLSQFCNLCNPLSVHQATIKWHELPTHNIAPHAQVPLESEDPDPSKLYIWVARHLLNLLLFSLINFDLIQLKVHYILACNWRRQCARIKATLVSAWHQFCTIWQVTWQYGSGELAQLVRAWGMKPWGQGYESQSWL